MSDSRHDDELLARLGAALATPRVEPDEDVRRQLLAALAEDQVVVLAEAAHRRGRRQRFARHASALSLGVAGVVALAGVAAAAVATDTLPGPTRAIAYDLGLPVTSPALERANAHLAQLVRANAHGDTTTATRVGRELIADLRALDRTDLGEIRTVARAALTRAGLLSLATGLLGSGTVLSGATTTATTAPGASSSSSSTSSTSSTSTTSTTATTTTTATTLVPVLPTLPVVGTVPGVQGSLNTATSSATSLLP